MPPTPARGQHRAQQPSRGLDGDLEQLSPLGQAKPTPGQTNIQMVVDDEDDEQQHEPAGEYTDDDNEEHEQAAPVAGELVTVALDSGTDPKHSGEFDEQHPGKLMRCFSCILNFPALSLVFPFTLFFSVLFMFLNVAFASDAFEWLGDPKHAPTFLPSNAGFVVTLLFTFLLIILASLATRQLAYQLFQGEIKPLQIVGLYLATIVLYADVYTCAAFMDPTSFVFAETGTNVISVWVGFLYFSVSTITCTGYGDIYPRYWFGKVIASSELLLSIGYHIGIFSIGLEHFQTVADSVAKGTKRVEESDSLVALAKARMKDLRTKYPRLDAIRKVFIRFVFMFSLLIQLVFLLVLHIFDGDMFNHPDRNADALIVLVFFIAQIVQFLLILLMTLALVRQVNRSAVSPLFLLQSWLSTVSLFCGIYVLIYILVPGFASFHLWDNSLTVQSTRQVADVVGQFFWFSLCTMTTTGYGDVYPVHLAARLAVCIQMVVSVCYTVVILGQALVSTVGFINQIRMERGAAPLRSSAGSGGMRPRTGTTTMPVVAEEDDEQEAVSLSGFEGAAPAGGEEDVYVQSEVEVEDDEEEEVQQPPSRRPAAAAAKPFSKAAAAGVAVGAAAAATPAGQQVAGAAKAGVSAARKALPGALAASQRGLASAEASAASTARAASAALEQRAPGLQQQVRREAKQAQRDFNDAARVGGAVVSFAASEAADAAMANPEVRQAVRAAKPKVAAAKQSVAQAASKAKAAANAGVQHAREKSRGMFDPTTDEEDEGM